MTNRFVYSDKSRLALKVRAAGDVIDLVVVVERDGDRAGNLRWFRSVRRTRVPVRVHN